MHAVHAVVLILLVCYSQPEQLSSLCQGRNELNARSYAFVSQGCIEKGNGLH
jgi:hypothetical protein